MQTDSPNIFIEEVVFLYNPRKKFTRTFAASFLMPASKVRAIVENEFGERRLTFEHVLYLKRYFGVSFAAFSLIDRNGCRFPQIGRRRLSRGSTMIWRSRKNSRSQMLALF